MGQKPKDKTTNRGFINLSSEITQKPLCKKCGAPTLDGMEVCALFPKCKHRSRRRILGEALVGKRYGIK